MFDKKLTHVFTFNNSFFKNCYCCLHISVGVVTYKCRCGIWYPCSMYQCFIGFFLVGVNELILLVCVILGDKGKDYSFWVPLDVLH